MTERAWSRLNALAAATAVGSVGLAAGGSASPLLAARMTGGEAAAGLPLGTVVSGSAVSALLIAWRTDRAGRAASLSMGYALGALGALVVVAGAGAGSFASVLAGCFLLGAANAALFLTRYAAADLARPHARGRAVGTVLFATTAGAVIGPNLLVPGASLARTLHLPAPTGLFLLAVPAFGAAGICLATAARGRGGRFPRGSRPRAARWSTAARTALGVLAAANLAMVAIMAIAPVDLVAHGHGLGYVGLVTSVHVAGMFAPSPLSGRLADRTNPLTVASLGLLLLVGAGVSGGIATLSSDATVLAFLIAVGVGWNAAMVGGSMLLVATVPRELRPHSEGIGEVAMGFAAAAGAPGAGLVAAFGGFRGVGVASALAATAGLGVAALARDTRDLIDDHRTL